MSNRQPRKAALALATAVENGTIVPLSFIAFFGDLGSPMTFALVVAGPDLQPRSLKHVSNVVEAAHTVLGDSVFEVIDGISILDEQDPVVLALTDYTRDRAESVPRKVEPPIGEFSSSDLRQFDIESSYALVVLPRIERRITEKLRNRKIRV